MNNADTIATDTAYITGSANVDLYSAAQTPRTFPKLRRTVANKNRAEHDHALAAVYSGFITPEDKETLTPAGYNASDMPDNFTDALAWRGRKYLTRRYLLSMFFRWGLTVLVCYYLSEITLALDSPTEINNPGDLALTAITLVTTVLGLALHFLPYVATVAYLGRILLLVTKRDLTHGAQLWLIAGNPLDPIRAWTRRTMLPLEDKALDNDTIGQTARIVLTTPQGGIVSDSSAYEALLAALAPQFHNGGYVSADERLRLIRACDPTIISGGVAVAPGGSHLVLYLLGVGHQTLLEVEYAVRQKYLQTAIHQVAGRFPQVANARVYFEIDPALYDCTINETDTRSRFWRNTHD